MEFGYTGDKINTEYFTGDIVHCHQENKLSHGPLFVMLVAKTSFEWQSIFYTYSKESKGIFFI